MDVYTALTQQCCQQTLVPIVSMIELLDSVCQLATRPEPFRISQEPGTARRLHGFSAGD